MVGAAALGMCSVNIHDFDTHWPQPAHTLTDIHKRRLKTDFLNTFFFFVTFLNLSLLERSFIVKAHPPPSHPNVCLVLYRQKHYLFLRPNDPHEDSTECTLTVISPLIFAQWTQIKAKWPLSDGSRLTVSTAHSSSLRCLCSCCTGAITTIHSLSVTE